MEYTWYSSDEPSTAPFYAARAVLPYLLVGNTRAANKALLLFTSRLSSSHPGLGVQSISSSASDIRIYPSLPLLNFLGLLLLAIQRGSSDLFKQLKPGGRMLIPIGQPFKRGQILYVYTKDAEGKVHSRKDVGVFFIPMTGAMMNHPKPGAEAAAAPVSAPAEAPKATE